MGGGKDSRIPAILNENIDIPVIVRTYSFDPEIANNQISSWVEELHPALVIGESLGAVHALAIKGVPHILVSPAINAAKFFSRLAFLTLIPGVPALCSIIWKQREGDRQQMIFDYQHTHKWKKYLKLAETNSTKNGGKDLFYAFFGRYDNYRKWGIVSIRRWKKMYGNDTYTIYNGTHFMEEEYIHSLLIPKILDILVYL